MSRDRGERSFSSVKKSWWIGGGILAVILIAVAVIAIATLSEPRRRIVVMAPPAPRLGADAQNEVERRLAEYRKAGEPVAITDYRPPPVDPAHNAALPLKAAAKTLETFANHPVWNLTLSPKLKPGQWQTV